MNLEVCKKCLCCDNLSVVLHCITRRNMTEPKVPLFFATLSTECDSGFHYRCFFQFSSSGNYSINSKFLGERFDGYRNVEMFQLKAEEYENFFNLLDSSCVCRSVDGFPNSSARCFCSLDHDVYDWNVQE